MTAPRWEPVPYWAKIPHGMTFRGSATSVAVDSEDRVYVFNRGSHPLMVFDPDGNLLDAWDDPTMVTRPHSIFIDADDNLWLIDDGGSFIDKRTRGGELLLRLGTKDQPVAARERRAVQPPVRPGRAPADRRPLHRRRLRQLRDPPLQRRGRAHHLLGPIRAPTPASSACPTTCWSPPTIASSSATARTSASRSSTPTASSSSSGTCTARSASPSAPPPPRTSSSARRAPRSPTARAWHGWAPRSRR